MSDSATPWTVAQKAPLSMGFPRQEYSSGLPFLSPGDLPNSRIKPASPALAGGFFTPEPSRKMHRKPRSSADFSGVKWTFVPWRPFPMRSLWKVSPFQPSTSRITWRSSCSTEMSQFPSLCPLSRRLLTENTRKNKVAHLLVHSFICSVFIGLLQGHC